MNDSTNLKEVVCNYAPIRFLPYRDTGEFVNVGVVVDCPQVNFFGFRLISPNDFGRLTRFFPKTDRKVVESALEGIGRELNRIQERRLFFPETERLSPNAIKVRIAEFREIVRRREGLIHFGEIGSMLADEANNALDELFARFTSRQTNDKNVLERL